MVDKIRASHLKLIALSYARNNIRGGAGILFTQAILFAGLAIAAVFITGGEELYRNMIEEPRRRQGIEDPNPQQVQEEKRHLHELIKTQIGEPVAKWATGDDDHAHYLVRTRPALVSAILMIMMFSMPFLACLGAFNQLAGDIQYKGLRYLLLRTERANIFLGRFIGTILFTMAILALLMIVIFLYLVFKADFYAPLQVAGWLLYGYVALCLFALPYVALCSWISGATDSPFLSLILCEIIAIFPIVFVALATNIHKSLEYVGWIMPWPFKYHLMSPNPVHVTGAAGAMLGFTALFLFLGLRQFQRRDL